MSSRLSSLSLFLLAVLAALPGTTPAQLLPGGVRPADPERAAGVQGRVRVKMTRQAYQHATFDGRIRISEFGQLADRFGFGEVRQWINPALLARATPSFKRQEGREYPTESLGRIVEVRYSSDDDPWIVVEALQRLRNVVEYAEPVYPRSLSFAPNDPHIPSQWYLGKIGALAAWDIQRADSTMVIAIVDSGIDPDHPDLKDALWINPGESGNGRETNGIDDDGNGFVDDVRGWDFYTDTPSGQDNDPRDYYGHGTHSAGCAAGIGNNGRGIAGVAWGARLMPVKITDNRTSHPDLRDDMQGMFYAAVMGAKVINMSFGGPGASRAEQEIINAVRQLYDPVLVAAAGNDDYGVDKLLYPGAYDGVFSVAATNEQDGPASFTNYNYHVDIAAPGTNIWTTDLTLANIYAYDNGTSFASPIVAGAAALVRAQHPDWSAERIGEVLRATSFDIRGTLGFDLRNKLGAGRLDLHSTLDAGASVSSARVLSFEVDEAVRDSAYMPGEMVRIRARVSNLLAPATSVTVSIAPDGTGISFDRFICSMGAMGAGEERVTDDTVFGFTIPVNAEPNSVLHFLVTVITQDRTNVESLDVPVARSWATTDINDIKLTFTSSGGIGFLGIGNRQGDGFSFVPRNGVLQGLPTYGLLYHGGVMIGTDAGHLSAAVRRGAPSLGVDTGFAYRSLYRLVTAPDTSIQTGTARFDDMNRSSAQRVGVDVTMTTEERRATPMNSLVLIRYRIRNVSGHTLQNLHCGLFLDWDIGFDPGYDTSGYEPTRRLAWQRSVELPKDIVAGAALLSNHSPRYSAVDHYIDRINPQFADSTRWRFLSSEFAPSTAQTDLGMVLGAGGITLAPDEETTVIFAVGAARSLDELNTGIDALQATVGAPAAPTSLLAPTLAVQPNPVVERAVVRFTQPARGEVTLAIYRPDGVRVALPLDGVTLDAGAHAVEWNSAKLPAGAYLVQLHIGAQRVQKLVVVER